MWSVEHRDVRCASTAAISARWISRPVTSSQCTTRWRVCAPSRPRSSWPSASRARRTPMSSRRWTCARPVVDAQLDDLAVAQAIAGDQRVLDVLLEAVVGREHRGDAALRPVRVGVCGPLLRDDDDAAVLGGEQREVEARDSRTDDEVIGLERLGHVRLATIQLLRARREHGTISVVVGRRRTSYVMLVARARRCSARGRLLVDRRGRRRALHEHQAAAGGKWKKVLDSEPPPGSKASRGAAAARAATRSARPTTRPSASTATTRTSTRRRELYRIPVPLIRAVIKVESDYDPHVVSSMDCKGLMQVHPTVEIDMGVQGDIFDPRTNIMTGHAPAALAREPRRRRPRAHDRRLSRGPRLAREVRLHGAAVHVHAPVPEDGARALLPVQSRRGARNERT